jgi:hypothetical protein
MAHAAGAPPPLPLYARPLPPGPYALAPPVQLYAMPPRPGPYAFSGGAGPPVLLPAQSPLVLGPASAPPPPVLTPLAPGSPPPPKTLRVPFASPRGVPVLNALPPEPLPSAPLPPRAPHIMQVLRPLPIGAPMPRSVVLSALPPNSPPPPHLAKKLQTAREAALIPDAPPGHGLRKTHVRRSSSYGSAFGDLLAGQCGLDPDAVSFAPPANAPPPPPLTPPRASPKALPRRGSADEEAAAIDAALRGLSPPAVVGRSRSMTVDDEAAAIDAALRGITPPTTPSTGKSRLRKRLAVEDILAAPEVRATAALSIDSARSALSAASSASSRRSAARSPLNDEPEPDTARTEGSSNVDWEETELVVDWVLGAA